jgi:glycerophosphoryl diester phosphodiesterase
MGIENVTFIAFYPWPLIKLRNMLHKKVHLQQLLEEGHYKTLYKWAKFFKMDIDIECKLLTQEMVDSFHKKKLKVNVWCADEVDELRKFEEMGVDYITTNNFNQNS